MTGCDGLTAKTVNFYKRKMTSLVREFTGNAITPVTEESGKMTYSLDMKSEKAVFGANRTRHTFEGIAHGN